MMGEWLAEGLEQGRAHRALGAQARQDLPQRLPLAPPVLTEWREGQRPVTLPSSVPFVLGGSVSLWDSDTPKQSAAATKSL